jgi:hypothetical protein
MLGDGTYRDEIDAGIGDGARCIQGDASRYFDWHATGNLCDSTAHISQGEIVEHDAVWRTGQCLCQFIE